MRSFFLLFVVASAWASCAFAEKGKILCNGKFKSAKCEITLLANRCKDVIRFEWTPLQFPGSKEWAEKHQNHCTIEITAQAIKRPKKLLDVKTCAELVELFSLAKNSFAQTEPADAKCEFSAKHEGFLIVSQDAVAAHDFNEGGTNAEGKKILSQAVRIEDLGSCQTQPPSRKGKIEVLCPVLTGQARVWFGSFFKKIGLGLQIRNAAK